MEPKASITDFLLILVNRKIIIHRALILKLVHTLRAGVKNYKSVCGTEENF